jgi:hypothetical protein
MRLDSAGNLGLGVTPSAWSAMTALQVKNASLVGYTNQAKLFANAYFDGSNYKYIASDYACELRQTSGQFQFNTAASGTAGNTISFTQAMTLDASGRLGIGETSPAATLDVKGANGVGRFNSSDANGPFISFANNGTAKGYIGSAYQIVASSSANDFAIQAVNNFVIATGGSTERARIDSSGNFLVGASSFADGSNVFRISGSTISSGSSVTTTRTRLEFNSSGLGTVGSISTNGSATTYSTSSDYRLKNTIAPMAGALAKVALLKPCTYKWNADGSNGEGFIAHELAEVCPDAVVGIKDAVDENGNPIHQGIDTSFLVATLTAAIQELKAEFDAYKASHP